MNGLKIRKLAAVVAGGALLGAAVAPMVSAITSSDAKSVVYSADMSPVVNIVVGQNAAVSDGVWAGNIARKVVEKAVMNKTYTGGASGSGTASVTDLAAVLSLGGTVTVTGGKTFNSAKLDSESSTDEYVQEIGQDPLAFLTDKTMSYKYNGSNTDITVKEKVGVKLNAKFDSDKDVKDLRADIDASDINYTLDLGAGIPIGSTDASTADFSDTSDDNIRIPFFGKTYLVQTVDITTSTRDVVELRLIEDKAKQTFVAGESFTTQGVGDYVGQTLTVTVVSVVATGPAATSYQAKFNLTDDAGNLIDTQTVSSGNFVEFEDSAGDDVVSGDIYMDTASVNTGTNEGTVDLLVGTSSLRLRDGENYPYLEAADSENIEGPYTVQITNTTDTNRLTKVAIVNQLKESIDNPDTSAEETVSGWSASVFDDENPLIPHYGHLNSDLDDAPYSFTFLEGTGALGEGFFAVTFNGLQTDEEITYLKIGSGAITLRDAQDSEHVVPFWMSNGETDTSTFSNGKSFTFDNGNKTLYYDINKTATDFNVVDGTLLNGVAVQIASGKLNVDGGTHDLNAGGTGAVTINGVTYAIDGNSSASAHLTADGYFHISKAALNSSTATSDYLNGLAAASAVTTSGKTPTEALANAFFYDDANVNGVSTAAVLFPLTGDNYNVAYAYQVIETDGSLAGSTINGQEGLYFYLLGDANSVNADGTSIGVVAPNSATATLPTIPYGSTMQNSKRLALSGTDTGEDNTPNRPYYYPQQNDVGQDASSTTIYNASFNIDENNGSVWQTQVYIDTQTDELPEMGDTDLTLPSSDVNYEFATGYGLGGPFSLSNEGLDNSLEWAYSDWGTKMTIANGDAEFWMPQNRPDIEFVVTGASSTTTVDGGEELTVAEGDTGTFNTGTQVTVTDITYTATVVGGDSTGSTVVVAGAPFTYLSPAPLNGKAQVFTTGSSVPGPKIIVGGPIVNTLAQEVADMLNATGDMVSGVYSGNIIVAGYTAEDTGAAAQDLIAALDSM